MTAQELIDKLKEVPPTTEIKVYDYDIPEGWWLSNPIELVPCGENEMVLI